MRRHIAEHAITDWRSAIAVAKTLDVDTVFVGDGFTFDSFPGAAIYLNTKGRHAKTSNGVTVICACPHCLEGNEVQFKALEEQRKHIYTDKSAR